MEGHLVRLCEACYTLLRAPTLSRLVVQGDGMQATITIQQEALSVVRSGIEMKRCALKVNAQQYRARLDAFEKRHGMDSDQFAIRFNSGELGDEADWFEWDYVLDSYRETTRQLELLKTVKL